MSNIIQDSQYYDSLYELMVEGGVEPAEARRLIYEMIEEDVHNKAYDHSMNIFK